MRVRLDNELIAELEAIAEMTHQSKGAFIKKALKVYFDNLYGVIYFILTCGIIFHKPHGTYFL